MNRRGRTFSASDAREWEQNMPTCGGDVDCNLGQMCPCWEAGADAGEQEGILQEQEAAVAEAMSVAKVEILKLFQQLAEPQVWERDPHLPRIEELKRKVLEVVS